MLNFRSVVSQLRWKTVALITDFLSKMVQHFRFTSFPTRLVEILEDPLAPCHDGQEEVTAEQKAKVGEGATAEDRRYSYNTQLARHLRGGIPALSIYLAHAMATGLAAGHRPLRLVLVSSVYFAIVTHVKLTRETCHFWKCFPIDLSEHLFSLMY